VTVLLVEDNPVDIMMVRQTIQDAGLDLRLHVTEDGQEALDFLHHHCTDSDKQESCPDLILLDLNLPKVNGKEVLAAIRQCSGISHIPVVILTTSTEQADVSECYSLYANCYVTKPMDMEQFSKAVQCIGGFWTQIAKLPSKN